MTDIIYLSAIAIAVIIVLYASLSGNNALVKITCILLAVAGIVYMMCKQGLID